MWGAQVSDWRFGEALKKWVENPVSFQSTLLGGFVVFFLTSGLFTEEVLTLQKGFFSQTVQAPSHPIRAPRRSPLSPAALRLRGAVLDHHQDLSISQDTAVKFFT